MNVSITSWQRRGAAAALRSLGRTTLPVVAIVGTVADAYGGPPPRRSSSWPTSSTGRRAESGMCLAPPTARAPRAA